MIKYLFAILLSVSGTITVDAQDKRALLIGIDHYSPPEGYQLSTDRGRLNFPDLQGCVNDALSIYSQVRSKFLFDPGNIDTLFNDAATREGIMKEMNSLLDKSKSGDFAFIYYAGHGSQEYNSLSNEADKEDETIVPSDAYKEGVNDIRDKELARIFNHFIDKGVKLTVILDCCHSGSLSRGVTQPVHGLFRFMPERDGKVYDSKDNSNPTPPEERKEGGFLIMSAAQDNQCAQEQIDDHDVHHGAFTIALIEALNQQSPDASAFNLFASVRAILKSNGFSQEPVLGGSVERQQETLLGFAKGTIPDKSLVAIEGFEKGKVILQGGFALGLNRENELVKFKGKDTLVKLRIDSIRGVNKSVASVVKGSRDSLRAGDLLEVTNWVYSQAPLLKLYIPPGQMNYEQVNKLAIMNRELKASSKIHWTNDLEKVDPTNSIFFYKDTCYMSSNGQDKKRIPNVTSAAILQLCKENSSFYFELPPPKELAETIKKKLKQNRSMTIVNNPANANYILYGTINNEGKASYGLRRAQTSAKDSLESMPGQTKYFALENDSKNSYDFVADSLYELAMKLSKIRGWLQLVGPRGGKKAFPFHLELRLENQDTSQTAPVKAYKVGDNISFHLVADKAFNENEIRERYVYVFAIDKNGAMIPCYPDPEGGNVANKFPENDENGKIKNDAVLFEGEITEPVGTDNYFLLASDEQIHNYAVIFKQEGVRGAPREVENPLTDLLNLGNDGGTRGFIKSPDNWTIYKLAVKTMH